MSVSKSGLSAHELSSPSRHTKEGAVPLEEVLRSSANVVSAPGVNAESHVRSVRRPGRSLQRAGRGMMGQRKN